MELEIPKERTFDCPQGTFRATFQGIREEPKFKNGTLQKFLRMTLEVDVPSIRNRLVTVARTFEPSIAAGTPLRTMLESWLGHEFFEKNAGKKIKLDELIGREADIIVQHFFNEGFPKPYCHLVAMCPPGTMSLAEED